MPQPPHVAAGMINNIHKAKFPPFLLVLPPEAALLFVRMDVAVYDCKFIIYSMLPQSALSTFTLAKG